MSRDTRLHPSLAERMQHIVPFQVMEVQRRAQTLEAQGRRIIHMEIGQPDFGAPRPVVEAGVKAMRETNMGYTGALGMPQLRERIAAYYLAQFGVEVRPEQIMVTAGASGAFLVAMGALIDPGDEVLLPDPCYPCTRQFVRMFGGRPNDIPVDAEQRFQLRASDLGSATLDRVRGAVIASPSNPTGTTITRDALQGIADALAGHEAFLLVDEIYQGLVYDHAPWTALSVAPHCVVVNSFSKYFCMTGWRLGWLVASADLVREMERLAQNAYICAPVPAQHAALAAFDSDTLAILEERREVLRQRRDFLVPALRSLGFAIPVLPDGAFYVYADCSRFSDDSQSFALRLLEEAGVAATPGLDFGIHGAARHVRFAYTQPIEELEEAVERMADFLRRTA